MRTRSGATAVGRVVNAYPAADLAVLKVELSPEAFLPLRPESPLPGEVVHALGHPLGTLEPGGFYQGTLRWSQTAGVISAVGAVSLQISAPVNPGNSGGRLCAPIWLVRASICHELVYKKLNITYVYCDLPN